MHSRYVSIAINLEDTNSWFEKTVENLETKFMICLFVVLCELQRTKKNKVFNLDKSAKIIISPLVARFSLCKS